MNVKKVLTTIGYWVLSCTWGIIMTLIGAIGALAMLVSGHKPHIFGYSVYFVVGSGWGGVNFGAFFFVAKTSDRLDMHQHEAGHGLQNLVFGVLMPFVVAIPSAVRCLIRGYDQKSKKLIAGLFSGAIALVGVVASILGFCFGNVVLGIGGAILAFYALWLAYWLYCKEIPQYEGGAYVDYDAVWFEGSATRLGETFFPAE